MSEIGEAVGGAVQGGLYARAVEPAAGEGREGHFHESACLNCGTELLGPHCHGCGQKAHVHRTISAFMHDLLHGALHFEGKMWRTLPLLAFRPGQLTRRYIDGERARFVSPMALFLFSVFLMFAVFQALGFSTPTNLEPPTQMRAGLASAHEKLERDLQAARSDLAELSPDDPGRAEAERRMAEAEEALASVSSIEKLELNDNVNMTFNLTGIEAIDEGIIAKWRENPSLMLYKLQSNSYKFSWLLIPLSIPFVWLLFAWRRKFKAYDHAIFVTYSLAFMSLLFLAASVLGVAGMPTSWVALAVSLIPPVHIYKQLRGTYGLSRFSAFWRLAALLVFIVIILTLFLQALLLLGAF